MQKMIYLASQSPRRQQLLEQWGLPYQLLLPDAQEDVEALEALQAGESAAAYVQRVTRLKLQAALARQQRRALAPAPVLCADTTVALGRRILGKPQDAAQARQMLTDLAGQRHRVLTAVALGLPATQPAQTWAALSVSWVRFAPLTPCQIECYVQSGEPMGKAGAYAIQGRAAVWISHISGSYSGIMGLPAHETAQLLRAAGLRPD
ncbi:Maf family protein [Hydrogenophaga sp.]|uniref:Maf family protein n=1 Tax=Hydrogenophaga sp. TaxID=1904254 RepID=UPI0019AEBE93|nr:Maf family protein [Hydrogenophaga sp.]MBD3893665.1 septum formation inhibitor Maf [Hydrogenophaga sp.]